MQKHIGNASNVIDLSKHISCILLDAFHLIEIGYNTIKVDEFQVFC